tara:strand:+ start:20 stop:637 length:618 start_codon:yes stop_codon:yes gene_type:complete
MSIDQAQFGVIKQQFTPLYLKASAYAAAYHDQSVHCGRFVQFGKYATLVSGIATGASGASVFLTAGATAYITAILGLVTTFFASAESILKFSDQERESFIRHRKLVSHLDDILDYLYRLSRHATTEDEDPVLVRMQLKQMVDDNCDKIVNTISSYQNQAQNNLGNTISSMNLLPIDMNYNLSNTEGQNEDEADGVKLPYFAENEG